VGDNYTSWAKPGLGDIRNTAKDLGAIVVMPEAARDFYTNWFNEGRRGDPGWERFYLDELIPQVEREYRPRGRPGPRRGRVAIRGLRSVRPVVRVVRR
jgi:S-formylglutathione hydrolase FrmB